MIILVFILDYYKEKLLSKLFKKSQNPYFGASLGPFCPNFGKKRLILEKQVLSVFKCSNYQPSCKNTEIANNLFLRKIRLVSGPEL